MIKLNVQTNHVLFGFIFFKELVGYSNKKGGML